MIQSWWLVGLLALMMMAAPVAAQNPMASFELSADSVEAPSSLRPDLDIGVLKLAWTITCPGPGQPAHTESTGAIHWNHSAALPGFFVEGAGAETVLLPDCVRLMSVSGSSSFNLLATSEAPGETTALIESVARLEWDTPAGPQESAAATWQASSEASYFGFIQVSTERNSIHLTEAVSTFSLNVSNHGNSRTNVVFEWTEGPASLEPPSTVTLESDRQGGSAVAASVDVALDAAMLPCGESTIVLQSTPVSTKNESLEGQPVLTNMLVRNDAGCEANESTGVPGVGLLLAPMLLALALILRTKN